MTKFQISNFQFQIIFLISAVFILTMLIIPFKTMGATLYLDPVSAKIGPDQTMEVKIKIGVDTNECINAAEIGIIFPSDILEVKDFNSGESFFSLWIEKPDRDSFSKINEEGKIIFSGGTPGGYCGRIPGDPGESNILGAVIFSVKKPILFHKAKLDFSSETQAFLNDGLGTAAKLDTQGAVLEVDEKITVKKDVWAEELAADTIPPEPFTLEIGRSPNVADNSYFVVFSAVDKQTGVDHYEIWEGVEELEKENAFQSWLRKIFSFKKKFSPAWEKTVSPHILKDQSLKSTIKVKAIDRAGNERMVEYDNAAEKILPAKKIDFKFLLTIFGGLIFVFVVISAVIFWKKRKNHSPENF